jgi:triosephosphate isomerase
MSTRKRLVVGNWKMYIDSLGEAKEFARALKRRVRGLRGVEVAVAPPAPLLPAVAAVLESSPVRVGAQGVSAFEGAHTGEVSAAAAKSAGADFAIVGHSERRALGDSNEVVHRQLVAAAAAGLMPILCVGELERSEDGAYLSVVAEQVRTALTGAQSLAGKLVVAYEPVWAINKRADLAPGAEAVREMVIFIRKTLAEILGRRAALKVPVLYGGSVEPQNAPALIADGDIGGFLVGHASVDLEQFAEILNACKK